MSTTQPIYYDYFKCNLGEFIIGIHNDEVCICDWKYRKMRTSIDKRIQDALNTTMEQTSQQHHLIENVKSQLNGYLTKKRKQFELPLSLIGTQFQQTVWKALLAIPYGTTTTYLSLAKQINNSAAIRAVAAANGANALAILVPCHRVIGSDGKMIGYAGGVSTKKKLLALEGIKQQLELPLEFISPKQHA